MSHWLIFWDSFDPPKNKSFHFRVQRMKFILALEFSSISVPLSANISPHFAVNTIPGGFSSAHSLVKGLGKGSVTGDSFKFEPQLRAA
jgi:hypothetical protein